MWSTFATFHFEMSALKSCLSSNKLVIEVTADTSHSPIGPCGQLLPSLEMAMHALTASLSACEFLGANVVAVVVAAETVKTIKRR